MNKENEKELINRRRRQILVHSYIYYRRNESIINDHLYDQWGMELVRLQKEYPNVAEECIFADEFKDYDGSSGFDLPIGDPLVISTSEKILKYVKNNKGGK